MLRDWVTVVLIEDDVAVLALGQSKFWDLISYYFIIVTSYNLLECCQRRTIHLSHGIVILKCTPTLGIPIS